MNLKKLTEHLSNRLLDLAAHRITPEEAEATVSISGKMLEIAKLTIAAEQVSGESYIKESRFFDTGETVDGILENTIEPESKKDNYLPVRRLRRSRG